MSTNETRSLALRSLMRSLRLRLENLWRSEKPKTCFGFSLADAVFDMLEQKKVLKVIVWT
jgi:hypothetical protein